MLRRLAFAVVLQRSAGPRLVTLRPLSTTVRGSGSDARKPPNPVPPAATVTAPEGNAKVPPQGRLTGDEVEEAYDPLGRLGRKVEEAVKGAAGTVQDVLDREDPITHVAEEAYHSVPKFQQGIAMQAERGKEKLEGFKHPEDRHGKPIQTRGQEQEGQAGSGGIMESVKEKVQGVAEAAAEGLKGGVAAVTEKMVKPGERHEDEMQAAAEADRRKRMREQRGESAEEDTQGEAAAQAGASGDVKAQERGGGHAENIVGAPVPPKDKEM